MVLLLNCHCFNVAIYNVRAPFPRRIKRTLACPCLGPCLGLGPCKPEVKQTAYNMLIRPKLEYSSPIWDPHTFSQAKSLERVQHSAARFVKNYYRQNTNPADLITARGRGLGLGWPTLERRRIIKQATTFYKILNNIIEITPPPRPTNLLSNPWTIRSPQVSYKCNGLFILSPSHSHMEYDSTKNYQHKKPKIISRSYYGIPFHYTSPKLPLKHSAQRKLIHGVGMETVYVCMWQGSDNIHTHNQPIHKFRLTFYT